VRAARPATGPPRRARWAAAAVMLALCLHAEAGALPWGTLAPGMLKAEAVGDIRGHRVLRISDHFEIVEHIGDLSSWKDVRQRRPDGSWTSVCKCPGFAWSPAVSADGRRCLVEGRLRSHASPGTDSLEGVWLLSADAPPRRVVPRERHDLDAPLPPHPPAGVLPNVLDPRSDPGGRVRGLTTEGEDEVLPLLGGTSAHRAALLGHADDVDPLPGARADLEARDRAGMTPLELAILCGNEEVAVRLLDRGVAVDTGLSRALMWSVMLGRIRTLRALVEHGADPNAADSDGTTPMRLAVSDRHGFLQRGGDPRIQLGGPGRSEVRVARADYLGCIRALLDLGADPAARDRWGQTPLHGLMLSSISPSSTDGDRAGEGLMLAAAAAALLARGADANAASSYHGQTPLDVGSPYSDRDAWAPVIDTLVAHGAHARAPRR
jgi:hypothetical protein